MSKEMARLYLSNSLMILIQILSTRLPLCWCSPSNTSLSHTSFNKYDVEFPAEDLMDWGSEKDFGSSAYSSKSSLGDNGISSVSPSLDKSNDLVDSKNLIHSPINDIDRNRFSMTGLFEATLQNMRDKLLGYMDNRGSEVGRQFSSMNFPSLEAALLSLAFLTFAVFVIDLVQDLFRGSSSTGRQSRSETVDDGMTDVIVLALSSIDTLSFGGQNPDCGQKLLCHLNRSGWHDGILGTASNYIVSLVLSVFSPDSGFQRNLDAANFGRENEDCTARYSACPSVLGDMLPS